MNRVDNGKYMKRKTALLLTLFLSAFLVLSMKDGQFYMDGFKAYVAGVCLLFAEKILDYFDVY